ncbi:MAG: hypothetical protein ABIT38_00735 [Gemmatimonadaceae bacterium]
MPPGRPRVLAAALLVTLAAVGVGAVAHHIRRLTPNESGGRPIGEAAPVTVHHSVAHDRSERLDRKVGAIASMTVSRETESAKTLASSKARDAASRSTLSPPDEVVGDADDSEREAGEVTHVLSRAVPPGAREIEQTTMGINDGLAIAASFDGIGVGFEGKNGETHLRNPSDNTLAVGPNHIVQIVNTRMAIFTKKGKKFRESGRVLYGPVVTNNVFRGFGGSCELRNNGDAVVRYDQLADRWLIVMPIFSRGPVREQQDSTGKDGEPARRMQRGHNGQPGNAVPLYDPPPTDSLANPGPRPPGATQPPRPPQEKGPYGMCYAVSTGNDPFGPYYRYEFVRPLFPDYPRPAVWPDGYYVPSSTGDEVIQKHACVVDRTRMLRGEDATEQCVIIDGVNFLNNADLDGKALPPRGAPNVMLAAGGSQLRKVMEDSAIYAWSFHVDWNEPTRTKVTGPIPIPVAPYHYLCNGQLTSCVSQPGSERRLDAQGDKIMPRLVYRRIDNQESIVAVHSVNSSAGAGGVRWYEFRIDKARRLTIFQQGTYAPDSQYRWMGSPAMDRFGNIGIGYSFGGTSHFAGQRFAGRTPSDARGMLSLKEVVLADGEGAQSSTLRWEDYTQTAIDPDDDCTVWYVGDYVKKGAAEYSTRIGAFRMPGCGNGSH